MEFEQRLAIALGQLIEQAPPRGVRQRVEHPVKIHGRCLEGDDISCNNFVA